MHIKGKWMKNKWLGYLPVLMGLGLAQWADAETLMPLQVTVDQTVLRYSLPDTWYDNTEESSLVVAKSVLKARPNEAVAIHRRYYDPDSHMVVGVLAMPIEAKYKNRSDAALNQLMIQTQLPNTSNRTYHSSRVTELAGKPAQIMEFSDKKIIGSASVFSKMRALMQIRGGWQYLISIGVTGQLTEQTQLEHEYQQQDKMMQRYLNTVDFGAVP